MFKLREDQLRELLSLAMKLASGAAGKKLKVDRERAAAKAKVTLSNALTEMVGRPVNL